MGSSDSGAVRPWARWTVGSEPPAWALWGVDRCDHQASVTGAPPSEGRPPGTPGIVFCARPRGHHDDHAERARGLFPRYAGGWWSWPDDGHHPEADTRARTAARVRSRTRPDTAAPGEKVCRARGEVRSPGPSWVPMAVGSEPVSCARPGGHALPHRSAPKPDDEDSVLAAIGAAPQRLVSWTWWQWPAPPVPEPTPAQRRRARLDRLLATLVFLVLLSCLVIGVLTHP